MVTPHFRKVFRGHARTVSENMFVKFEVHTFNRVEAIRI